MTARSRFLGGVNSPPSSKNSTPEAKALDSDFIVILAGLLCALICVLGLIAVARCTGIRRILIRGSAAATRSESPPSSANKGLKKKVLKSLPKMTYGGDDCEKFSDCAICLSEYAAGEEIRVLPQCGHGFHVACIDTWLGSHSSCPSCRQILVSARCQKCGGVPTETCSSAARPQALPRETHLSSFLP